MGLDDLSQVFERLHIDPVVDVVPKYVGPPIPEDEDVFGIGYSNTDYGTGHYRDAVRHPLAAYSSVKEIDASGKIVFDFGSHQGAISCAAWTPAEKLLVTGTWNGIRGPAPARSGHAVTAGVPQTAPRRTRGRAAAR